MGTRFTDLQNDTAEFGQRDADRPIRLILALAPGEGIGVKQRDPATLSRTPEAVQNMQDSLGIVDCGGLNGETLTPTLCGAARD
jgi:hypothetical protein